MFKRFFGCKTDSTPDEKVINYGQSNTVEKRDPYRKRNKSMVGIA